VRYDPVNLAPLSLQIFTFRCFAPICVVLDDWKAGFSDRLILPLLDPLVLPIGMIQGIRKLI
jgi:hypothetical protein